MLCVHVNSAVLIFHYLKKNNFEKAFYAVIVFISSIIIFALPLAKTFYTNEDYLSINTLRLHENLKDVKLFSTDKVLAAPELIFELGEPIKRVRSQSELPDKNKFGLLVNDTIPKEVKANFSTKFIAQFDENHSKKGSRGHRPRRTIKLYLLEKN